MALKIKKQDTWKRSVNCIFWDVSTTNQVFTLVSSLCPLWLLSSSCVSLLFSSFSFCSSCVFVESASFRASLDNFNDYNGKKLHQSANLCRCHIHQATGNEDTLTSPGTDPLSSQRPWKAALWIHSDLLGTWSSHSSFFQAKNNSDKYCDHSQTHKQYQMLLETKINFSTDILSKYFLGKLPSLTWVSISFLELRSSSSKAWASFFSCIKPFFSFVICSRASAVLPEASVA